MKNQSGLGLIEMTLVIIIVAILFIEGYKKISHTVGDAEKAQAQAIIGALKSAIAIQYANLIITNQKAKIANLIYQNPFDFLQPKPSNYAGLITTTDQALEKQKWFYNTQTNELLYTIKNKNSFTIRQQQLRYKLLLGTDTHSFPRIGLWKVKEQNNAN